MSVGLIGGNGAGKSTLLSLIWGWAGRTAAESR
jgi:ABC-type polysaccharide/polyol phosphate transport system ATPase subunit